MSRNAKALLTASFVCLSTSVLAQSPASPHVPLQKTIGQARPEIVPSLIVMNARSANLQGGTLTLTGVAPSSIVFADRPVRAAGHSLTTTLLEEWSPANDSNESFAKDPPNATISVFSSDGSKVQDAVVVLKSPVLEGDRLTFAVDVLEGGPLTGDGPAAIFIDRFGFGGFHGGYGGFHGGYGGFHAGYVGGDLGRVGYGRVGAVGVWNRPYVYRGAWYRGAGLGAAALGGAALGAAAVGAAASAYPYYGTCGYYPYPPCY
jgi:hypothetical protein